MVEWWGKGVVFTTQLEERRHSQPASVLRPPQFHGTRRDNKFVTSGTGVENKHSCQVMYIASFSHWKIKWVKGFGTVLCRV